MLVLGVDTATAQTSVAIGGPDGVVASFHLRQERRHTETVAPAVEFVCRQAGVTLDDVTIVAADVGPGLFSGLRVGVATAKAIAYARELPVVGVSSLDLVAFAARVTARRIVAAIDAMRDEVYYATYLSDGGGVRQTTAPAVASPETVADYLKTLGEDCLLVGDGARRYADVLAAGSHVEVAGDAFQFPSAASLVEMASAEAMRGRVTSASAVEIVYLREPYVHRKRRDRGLA